MAENNQKGNNWIKITTEDAYDYNNQEYFRIPQHLVQTLYQNLAAHYKVYEFYETSDHKVIHENNIAAFLKLNPSGLKKLIFSGTKYLIFEEVDCSKLDREFIFEMHLVVVHDLHALLQEIRLKKISLRSFRDCRSALSRTAPSVISIYDSSDIEITFLDEGFVDVALNGLQEYFL